MSTRLLNLALIGAGSHARQHHGEAVKTLRQRLGRVVLADISRDAAIRFQQDYPVDAIYDNVDTMMQKERPDAVVAVTPVAITGEMTRRLAVYNVPMLMEKPFGQTREETEELCHLVSNQQLRVMISFNRRFIPAYRRLVTRFTRQKDDRPAQIIRVTMLRRSRFERDFITATAVHLFDALLNLTQGEIPDLIHAKRLAENNGATVLTALLSWPTNLSCIVTIHSDCGLNLEHYEVMGNNYRLEAELQTGYYRAYENGKLFEQYGSPPGESEAEHDGAVDELAYFLDQVASNASNFQPGPKSALVAAELAEILDNA